MSEKNKNNKNVQKNNGSNSRNKGKEKDNKKKTKVIRMPRTPIDIITDIIVILILALIVWMLVMAGMNLYKSKHTSNNANASASPAATAVPTTTPLAKGKIAYTCAVAGGEETNSTNFQIVFDTNTGKYEETITASGISNSLDSGKFTEKDSKIVTVSSQHKDDDGNKTKTTYIKDGDYIIAEDSFYDGTLPDNAGKNFNATFTYSQEGSFKTTLIFNKNGKYLSTTKSTDKSSKSATSTSTVSLTGSYEKDGNFITREADNGEVLLDFYVYNNKISNSYYVKN